MQREVRGQLPAACAAGQPAVTYTLQPEATELYKWTDDGLTFYPL